jgi:hypothetical protein
MTTIWYDQKHWYVVVNVNIVLVLYNCWYMFYKVFHSYVFRVESSFSNIFIMAGLRWLNVTVTLQHPSARRSQHHDDTEMLNFKIVLTGSQLEVSMLIITRYESEFWRWGRKGGIIAKQMYTVDMMPSRPASRSAVQPARLRLSQVGRPPSSFWGSRVSKHNDCTC